MKKTFLIGMALLSCACIKPPDDGMALGEPTSEEAVNEAKEDAAGNVPEEKAFHVNDRGIYRYTETIFTSTQVKASEIITLTKMDPQFIYYEVEDENSGKKAGFKLARSQPPAPTPVPTAAPKPTTEVSQILRAFRKLVSNFKLKINYVLSKVTIQVSTAVGETHIPHLIPNAFESADQPVTQQYFGLKTLKHIVRTNNTSQIPGGRVNATHIEYNVLDNAGKKTHWVLEMSNEVPGLFVFLSVCASAVAIVNNGQVPYMECKILDGFTFGGN